jgi:hypothetical protein
MRYFSARVIALLLGAVGMTATMAAQQAAKTPDLSGVWNRRNVPGARYGGYAFMQDEPPMTPWAQERFKATKPSFGPRAVVDSNDPVNPTTVNALGCFPPGVPRIYLHPFPMEIVQSPKRVLILYEFDHFIRQIWTDGRPHLKDLPGSWMGDSIGHWEGDTLVVDTTGFNDKTWVDRAGHPHSESLHVVERMRRVDDKTLQIDVTIDDPIAYTKPWGGTLMFQARPDWSLSELICVDNVNFDAFLKNEKSK